MGLAAKCTFDMKESDEDHTECDYITVESCSFGDQALSSVCEVKRKGTSTWRNLDAKPSLKLKLGSKLKIGNFPCLNGVCPPGSNNTNEWESKKFTLNNQIVWDGEIDAYEVYRSYIPASVAVQVSVALYRDGVLQSNETYAMVETVNDKAFVEKWFGEDVPFRLYEVESGVSKFERGGGVYKDADDDDADPEVGWVVSAEPTTMTLGLYDVDRANAVRYLAAGRYTDDWDGACGNNNNYYLLNNNISWFHIPWGLDRTFSCSVLRSLDKCHGANECLEVSACRADYDAVMSEMQHNDAFRTSTCPNVVTMTLVNTALQSAVLVAVAVYLYASKYW